MKIYEYSKLKTSLGSFHRAKPLSNTDLRHSTNGQVTPARFMCFLANVTGVARCLDSPSLKCDQRHLLAEITRRGAHLRAFSWGQFCFLTGKKSPRQKTH